ncbi:MAG TPA: c-type cytochrome [Terriglobales bacterium]|nr:c-type cytochrome [Terriglobales bacterium]
MKSGLITAAIAFIALSIGLVFSMSVSSSAASDPEIERGRYLVTEVAKCGDCHTPMNDKGELIQDKWLQGAQLSFKPAAPVPEWAERAPNIAGLRGWEEASAIKFFMTGIAYNDLPPRPPMPQYHMTKEDATAIVHYLKSLSPTGQSK